MKTHFFILLVCLFVITLIASGVLILILEDNDLDGSSVVTTVFYVGIAMFFTSVAVHFVHCFTRNLPASDVKLSKELRAIFVYGYSIQADAIGVSLAPFAVEEESTSSQFSWAGVVYGCLHTDRSHGSELIHCGDNLTGMQWLVHVGSRTDDIHASNGVNFNSEESVDDVAHRSTRLSGGLVIPLYVIVLAFIGSAVGMARRLPEIQRRAANSTESTKCKDAITPIKAREMIVFQIMQVLTAPLIAIVGFSAFEPDTVATTVLIGFVSGFSSETILMKLRQASDAVIGKTTG